MKEGDFKRSVYIKATVTDTMAALNKDLKQLRELGIKYVFIDEVTLISDFIDSAAILSDIYSAMGMKIVLSGTDSLGFWLAVHEELYDRAVMVHTTYIPFSEHSRLLGIMNQDNYFNKRDFQGKKNETYCLIDYHCQPLYTVNGDNMNLSAYIKQQGISVYSLSKKSAVPYTTLCSICNGTADVMECRVNTLVKIADSLGVNLLDLINSSLVIPQKYNFINGEIRIEFTDLPKALKNTIKELEEYDRNNDTMFYECADMLYMMADRFLKDGAIDSETRDKLIMKYPIA